MAICWWPPASPVTGSSPLDMNQMLPCSEAGELPVSATRKLYDSGGWRLIVRRYRRNWPLLAAKQGRTGGKQGGNRGDGFAYDCAHHHPVSANRTFSIRSQIGRFRGDFRPLISQI